MVELKAISKLDDIHLAQALNYLEAYKLDTGLLINFGAKTLEFKRVTNEYTLKKEQNQRNPLINKINGVSLPTWRFYPMTFKCTWKIIATRNHPGCKRSTAKPI
jgi:hypothetical protein